MIFWSSIFIGARYLFIRGEIIALGVFLPRNIIRGKESVTSANKITEGAHCCGDVVDTKIREVFDGLSNVEAESALQDLEEMMRGAQKNYGPKGKILQCYRREEAS